MATFVTTAYSPPFHCDCQALSRMYDSACRFEWAELKAIHKGARRPQDGCHRHIIAPAKNHSLDFTHQGQFLNALASLLEKRRCLSFDGIEKETTGILARGRKHFTVPVIQYLCTRRAQKDPGYVLRMVEELGELEEEALALFALLVAYSSRTALNHRDHRYYTALASACVHGYAKFAKVLLLGGAEAYAKHAFLGTNAVSWDRGNCNALIKAQVVFKRQTPGIRAAKIRCEVMIETLPRLIMLYKCRKLRNAGIVLSTELLKASRFTGDHCDTQMQLDKARSKLHGMSFLCDRCGTNEFNFIPNIMINHEGGDDALFACIRYIIEGEMITDVWREFRSMLGIL